MARLILSLLSVGLFLAAAFVLWMRSTELEVASISGIGLLPAGIGLAVLATVAALAAVAARGR